ncbi:MarR family winged helix-turn-helix transcriptional regulator [Nocardia sp. XZ_19_369]|uniref:MarR family winged helix-turn-helix transcriptional regulator n=1 Tax=Nocardia sp. XZ_19_369 TaxID=2769487 RepID=UPI00188ECF4E|nr:MarR family transcriptional regulator [Nocardia sp. XZ_19_369]
MNTATELSRLLGPLRRTVLRATRAAKDLPDLPEAQIELLRALSEAGSLSPSDAARQLQVAPSTISNLTRRMIADRLVQRHTSDADLRAVTLTATAEAIELLNLYDHASTEILSEAISRLPPAEQKALTTALPSLEHLLAELH